MSREELGASRAATREGQRPREADPLPQNYRPRVRPSAANPGSRTGRETLQICRRAGACVGTMRGFLLVYTYMYICFMKKYVTSVTGVGF